MKIMKILCKTLNIYIKEVKIDIFKLFFKKKNCYI